MTLRRLIQKLVLNGVYFSGLHQIVSPLTAGRGVFLTFHRVRPSTGQAFAPNAHLEVTPEFLGEAVDHLRRRGRDIVGIDEALDRLNRRNAPRFAVITFDDGYRDNFRHAWPVLKQRRAPFTVYISTGMIDRAMNPWWMVMEKIIARESEVSVPTGTGEVRYPAGTLAQKHLAYDRLCSWLWSLDEDTQRAAADDLARRYRVDPRALLHDEMMDWGEVRQLASDPLVTIGAHTVNHHALAKLPVARVVSEVLESVHRLRDKLGRRPRHFAYPYGRLSAAGEREFALLADLDLTTAVRTVPGTVSAANLHGPTALPRISANGHFQAIRYLDVLISGAPFVLKDRMGIVPDRRPAVVAQPGLSSSASRR
jgi:peptidoglycan/xylan/chitin deacetylase (PgdA/CDA1 family)